MAAGDIALKMLLSAQDLASSVVVTMAATYNDAILSMTDATVALNDYLISLGEQATATALEFDTLGASADAADISFANLDLSVTELDASLTTIDATTASADASIASLDASLASVDASLAAVDASAAGVDAALASETVAADSAAISMANLSAAQDVVGKAGGALSALKGPAMIGLLAVAAVGFASTKMAGDYESSTNTLVTGAGEQADNLDMVRQAMLNLSVDSGTTTKNLVSGMFQIESAGYHGADGMITLAAVAEGAKVGAADLGVVANGTTTIMTDFGLKSSQASVAVNTLIATVANGKTTMNQLSGSLSQILPTASSAKIGLNDTMAAMATMTGEGVPAANAATYLRQTIMALVAPSKQTVTALQSVGLSSTQVATEMQKSLPTALKEITDAVGKKFPEGSAGYVAALKNIAGGSKQMQGILDLTGTHMATFTGDFKNIAGAVQQGGNSITGWNRVQSSFNQQMDQARAAGEAFLIMLGTRLMPIFGQVVAGITPVIQNLMLWETRTHGIENALNSFIGAIRTTISVGAGIVSFFQHNQVALVALGVVLIAVAGAIAGMLVAAFVAWAVAAWAAAIATLAATWPILAIGALIALVVAGIVLAVMHWGQIVAWLSGVWSAFASWFGGIMSAIGSFFHTVWTAIATFFESIWNRIIGFLQAAWNVIVNIVKVAAMVLLAIIIGPLGLLVIFIIQHWTQIQAFLASVWNGIVSLAKTVWNAIVSAISTAIQAVVGWFVWLFNHNYYFHDLVVGIMVIFNEVKAFLITLWTAVSTWLGNAWNTIKTTAILVWTAVTTAIHTALTTAWKWIVSVWTAVTSWLASAWNTIKAGAIFAWTAITSSIHAALTAAWNWIVSIWNTVVGFLLGIWNRITGQVSSAWSKISSIFGSAWSTYIAGPLGGLWTSFTGWFNNLISQVGQWGANLMQGFINGIMGMLGNLKGALGSVMSTVAGWLGFHSPTKEGEGRYIVEWGAGMVKGFVAGMQQAQPLLNAQINHMISAPNTIGYAGGGNAGAGNAFALSGGGNTHTIIVQMHPSDVYLDNKKVGESVMKYANHQVHATGAYRNG